MFCYGEGEADVKRVVSLLLAALLAFAACGLAACSGSTPTGKSTLIVGVRSDIMNFGYLNEQTGKYYGMEIDIAEELAERLGYSDVEYVTVTPDDRKEMLLAGEVDCLIACYSISDTRLENFDFSPAYYTDTAGVMVEKSSLITNVKQLKGETVGIMNGSNTGPILATKMYELGLIGYDVIENNDDYTQYEGMLVKKYPSYDALSDALETGEVDAAAMDGAIAQAYRNDDRSMLDINLGDQEYGVATQKGSSLSGSVSENIQAMIDDGTIAALADKWN